MRLFEIGEEARRLDDLLDECEGDISDPAAADAVSEWFAFIMAAEATKLDDYVRLVRQWEGELAVAKAEKEQYAKREKSRELRVERFKTIMRDYLISTGQKFIVTTSGRTIRLQVNGTRPLILSDEATPDKLPLEFIRVTSEVDGQAIRQALKAGESLPFASLGDAGFHTRIT